MESTVVVIKRRITVGVFTLVGLSAIGIVTVLVNDRPYWWRPCQLVRIHVEDATGLKTRSPIRSLGLEIGYLDSVELSETKVELGICITAQVEVLTSTRAYIRSEGFLGDKFVELKPVRYLGGKKSQGNPQKKKSGEDADKKSMQIPEGQNYSLKYVWFTIPAAVAAEASDQKIESKDPTDHRSQKQIPMGESTQDFQHLINRVDSLVNEMTGLTTNLKQALDPEDLKATMKQLNKTLESASKTLSPEGGLNQTAQRTLAKLEDAIEQLRDQLTRINQGQGSVGMILNDPKFAQELLVAMKNVNQLLSRVGGVRFILDLGTERFRGYSSGRSSFRLGIWPKPYRYYLLGFSIDQRGKRTETTTQSTTTIAAVSVTETKHTILTEPSGVVFTGMLGTIYQERWDLSVGFLHGEGTISVAYLLGSAPKERDWEARVEAYTTGTASSTSGSYDARFFILYRLKDLFYVKGGLEGFRRVNGVLPFFAGAGISFDDEDVKLLFTFLR